MNDEWLNWLFNNEFEMMKKEIPYLLIKQAV